MLENYESEISKCANNVKNQLDQQIKSRYVTRFNEKNALTFRCVDLYESWHKLAVQGKSGSPFVEKENQIQRSLRETFRRANEDEEKAFEALVKRVESGTKLVKSGCPFHNTGVTLPKEEQN
eukprot:TRINITY_DN4952_c0_g1_i1.p1 TRINITY_DN4952_c0_g1~~TRINITY_DN4952_c0_g1_i1.p1  ORF type:complete len:129 (+),score=17.32 TRINITY_DN4952_c0_g1_i1:22-387(+)